VDAKAPFDATTVVDAVELAEWLRLEVDEVKMLARAGVFPRNAEGRFPLVRAIQGYLKLEEARSVHALAARADRSRRAGRGKNDVKGLNAFFGGETHLSR
jgi:hypothetical protein